MKSLIKNPVFFADKIVGFYSIYNRIHKGGCHKNEKHLKN
jgi:hypothetical protein